MGEQPQHSRETPEFRDGYYYGETDEGVKVGFIVRPPAVPDPEPDRDNFPWQAAVITTLRVSLRFVVTGLEEGPFEDTLTFDIENLSVLDNGSFGVSEGEPPLLFGINGLLLPNGQASGMCIGTTNGSIWHRTDRVTRWLCGSSGWRDWHATWKEHEGVGEFRFLA
jgi:hypothetical protein